MKNIIYNLIKFWIKTSLHLYHGSIKVVGLEKVPTDKPVLFLPNHQNALLDPLLLAVDCNRKPFFLTRSDVFTNSIFNKLFDLIRMIPIYRIRDGRDSLKRNDEVFKRCARLLAKSEALLMFPEANHNLRRRVRPLSKGFTRILFRALELEPTLDIQLVPVGFNYLYGEDFPDQVAIFFGEALSLQELVVAKNKRASVENIKRRVSDSLQKLTTHLPEENYEEILKKLNRSGADFLNPFETNALLKDFESTPEVDNPKSGKSLFNKLFLPFFTFLNLPIILIWKIWLKKKVWEPEFTATLRFSLALVAFPIYYLLLLVGGFFWFGPLITIYVVIILFIFNWAYVKLG